MGVRQPITRDSEMHRIDPKKTAFARRLRHDMTEAEQRLWRALRSRQMGGLKFRRQFPLVGYIADFVCMEAMLVIEVDGGQHASLQLHDSVRSACIEAAGFRVLRFWNHEVLEDIEAVKSAVWQALSESGALHPHPNLPPARGKEKVAADPHSSPGKGYSASQSDVDIEEFIT